MPKFSRFKLEELLSLVPIDFSHPLVRRQKVSALLRFISWQIKSRLIQRDFVFSWIGDSKFYVRNGENGLTQNIYVGLQEFEEMCLTLHLLKPGDLFVDAGSNSGSYSILAGRVARSDVIAIEPIKSTYYRLKRNMELNAITNNTELLNVALGASTGELKMTANEDTTNHVVSDSTLDTTELVRLETIDQVLKSRSPILVKIDVEGWESEVLSGGTELLADRKLKAIIIELNESGLRYGYDDLQLIAQLKRYDFEMFSYDPFERILIPLESKRQGGGNTIFIRDLEYVLQRIQSAPYRKILSFYL